jgi:hypothetical protein
MTTAGSPTRASKINPIRTSLNNLEVNLIIILLQGQTFVETPHTFTTELVPEIQLLSYLLVGNPNSHLFTRELVGLRPPEDVDSDKDSGENLSEISLKQVNWDETHLTRVVLNIPFDILTDLVSATTIRVHLHQNPQIFYLPVQLEIHRPDGSINRVDLPKLQRAIYNDLEDKNWLQVPQPIQLTQEVQTILGTLGGPKLYINGALIETIGPFSFYKGLN